MNTRVLVFALVLGSGLPGLAATTSATSETGSLDSILPAFVNHELLGNAVAPAALNLDWIVSDDHPGTVSVGLYLNDELQMNLGEGLAFASSLFFVVPEAGDYSLLLEARDSFGNSMQQSIPFSVEAIVEAAESPLDFALAAAWPNPFNPVTQLDVHLDQLSQTRLRVFDLTGGLKATLVDGLLEAGHHSIRVDGSSWSSGVYVAVLEADGRMDTMKLVLCK